MGDWDWRRIRTTSRGLTRQIHQHGLGSRDMTEGTACNQDQIVHIPNKHVRMFPQVADSILCDSDTSLFHCPLTAPGAGTSSDPAVAVIVVSSIQFHDSAGSLRSPTTAFESLERYRSEGAGSDLSPDIHSVKAVSQRIFAVARWRSVRPRRRRIATRTNKVSMAGRKKMKHDHS
jgi:hypothetical protein